MPKVPYPYEVNGKLVTGKGSLIPICSLSNHSLLPSLTVLALYCRFSLSTVLLIELSDYSSLEAKPEIEILNGR